MNDDEGEVMNDKKRRGGGLNKGGGGRCLVCTG